MNSAPAHLSSAYSDYLGPAVPESWRAQLDAALAADEKVLASLSLDLDASLPPLNAYPYEMNRYVLEEIVPPAALNDYWLNEWPLAYRLGRVHLRLHGSQDPNRPTEGCLNCGVKTGEILQLLVELGALAKEQILPRPPEDPKTLGWKVAPGLGKTFVVVKDLN